MEDDDFISKTQRKRRMTELQALGAALVALSPERLARLELPEALREAVIECKRLTTHEAIRRQMQYIGRIMREVDAVPIAEQLTAFNAPTRRQTALFHLAEHWRDALLRDPAEAERFAREFPGADGRGLRTLAEQAREERGAGRSPRRSRELFHALNAAIQENAKRT